VQLAAQQAPVTQLETADPLQAWLLKHAVAVRSIDPKDEDFSDLEPLIGAIGSARVVQMGEPSHGAGAAFAAKARIIKFLHQRMGFDVVAWESGLYDVRLAQAAIRCGGDAITAAQRGILAVWSNAEEVRALFDYVKATQSTTRPIEMAGIDMQVSAPGTDERFGTDLRSFAAALPDAGLRRTVGGLSERAIAAYIRLAARRIERQRRRAEASAMGLSGQALDEAMSVWEKGEGEKHRPTKTHFDDFVRAVEALLSAIRSNRASYEGTHGAIEVGFMERAIENMRGRGTDVFESERSDAAPENVRTSSGWNRRDALMAGNLRWLVDQAYPGRKVIVWAHNAHLMKAHFAADWRSVHAKPQPNGMTPTGALLTEWLGDRVYAIAVTTYEGEELWTNGQRRGPIAPAAEGSLESRLHRLGKPLLFLDLRSARRENGSPARTPQSLRVSGYGPPTGPYGNDRVPDLTRAFDAIFYVDRMTPATPICRGPCPDRQQPK
jgi:erythromycin esterase